MSGLHFHFQQITAGWRQRRVEMTPFSQPLSSHSSSASLSMLPLKGNIDGVSDDVNIAKGLLSRPKVPQRQSSFPTSTGQEAASTSHQPDRSLESFGITSSRRAMHSSNTWTLSSADVLSDQDDQDDRSDYIEEYNRLARKHGVRIMVVADYSQGQGEEAINTLSKSPGWFSRNILRRTSSVTSAKTDKQLKHRRSISDLSLKLRIRKDRLRDKNLQELVRLCGSSLLYLPAEYAAASLTIPTCFRATAQYLVQHAPSARGIFRIPGAHNVVEALYNHFCLLDEDGEVVSGTVRRPTLPDHIRCDVHDVASAFKRFLSGLPGGILGSLPLFDALVAIQGQLLGDAEFTRTKQSKVRARLIALAIATLKSQYRRDLICAVFGLLCMIGRASETARREDDRGRPLPTSDLMGYTALGIVFGPLLTGDLLENYHMHFATPHSGLVLLPVSPPKSRKERKKKRPTTEEGTSLNSQVDKIKIANGITEMLITHWRDVVRHMKSMNTLKSMGSRQTLGVATRKSPFLRPSASETFALRKPPDWDVPNPSSRRPDRSESPTPIRRIRACAHSHIIATSRPQDRDDLLFRKQRTKPRPTSGQLLSGAKSMNFLSPTEEHPSEDSGETLIKTPKSQTNSHAILHPSVNENDGAAYFPLHPCPALLLPNSISYRKNGHGTSTATEDSTGGKKSDSRHLTKAPINFSKPYYDANPSIAEVNFGDDADSDAPIPKKRVPTPSPSPRAKRKYTKSIEKAERQITKSIRKSETRVSNTKQHGNFSFEVNHDETPVKQPKHRKHQSADNKRLPQAGQPINPFDINPFNVKDDQQSYPTKRLTEVPIYSKDLSALTRRKAVSDNLKPIGFLGLKLTSSRRGIKSAGDIPSPHHTRSHSQMKKKNPTGVITHAEDLASLAALARVLGSEDNPSYSADSWERVHRGRRKDALTTISPEEDVASLNALAQVLNCEETAKVQPTQQAVSKDPLTRVSHEEDIASLAALAQVLDSNETANEVGSDTRSSMKTSRRQVSTQRGMPENEENRPGDAANDYSSPKRIRKRSPAATPKEMIGNRQLGIALQVQGIGGNPKGHGASSGSVKALAEKFNNPTTTIESGTPLKPSPRKSLSKETWMYPESPNKPSPRKDSIVAPYTTNPPSSKSPRPRSPDKPGTPQHFQISQRSRTPQPRRKPVPLGSKTKSGSEGNSDPAKSATPRRGLIPSLDESKALLQTLRSNEDLKEFAINSSNPFPMALRHIGATTEISPGLRRFDRPRSIPNIGKVLPVPELPAVAQHIQFSRPSLIADEDIANFVQTNPNFSDVFKKTPSPSREQSPSLAQITPPSRSNSVLHSQIRTFQTVIIRKNDDIRKLKQQLDTRSNLDIGTLSEQLREAKREIHIWRNRAEVAEKQVKMFSKLPTGHVSSNRHSVELQHNPARSTTNYIACSDDETRTFKKARDMDGARSSPCSGSGGSNGTIVHDDAAMVNRNLTAWMQQTMETLGEIPI